MGNDKDKALVSYKARDGQMIDLSFDTVRKFLVSGRPEYVTDQEIFMYMGMCRARGLNPFKRDCYLVKYTQNDTAAIIVSIDYYRSRAAAQENCQGWQAGPIVMKKDGTLRYSNGLVLEDEKLVGGWFEAQPQGWTQPLKIEVNLKQFLKHTQSGALTRFWREENQPGQIAKVAESQGLRRCWPDEFAKLYTEEEILPDVIDITAGNGGGPESEPETPLPTLDEFLAQLPKEVDKAKFKAFLQQSAAFTKKPIGDIVAIAVNDFADTARSFERWLKKQEQPKEAPKKGRGRAKTNEEPAKQDEGQAESQDDIDAKLTHAKKNLTRTFKKAALLLGLIAHIDDGDSLDIASLTDEQKQALHARINTEIDKEAY